MNVAADFPFLQNGDLHYLDNAATTQKPAVVIDAISRCYQRELAPVHRGLYPLAEQASQAYEKARVDVGRFINSPTPKKLIFTHSCTEAINMVAQGWARQQLTTGDRVWVTRLEHHTNFLPWQRVCQQTGAELCVIELDEQGYPLLDTEGLFDASTKLIAIAHVSNVLGVENKVTELCTKASEHGIRVLVDGAQAVAHMAVDVEAIDCDFYAFSAHKMYGPSGIGALYVKPELLSEMEPFLVGGGMVDEVGEHESTWSEAPECFEAGSQNLSGAIGFAAAANYLSSLGMDNVHVHISDLCEYAAESLTSTSGVHVFTSGNTRRSSLLSFEVEGVHPHDFGHIAGESEVAIRAGHHCCQPLMRHLGVAATNRVSFAVYNTREDIDKLMTAVTDAQQLFLEV